MLPSLAQRGGLRRELRICDTATATREWEAIERLGGRHIILGDPDYPTALAAVSDAPAVLSVLGNAELLGRTSIGVVGARNASTNGRRFAEKIARDLTLGGAVVVSGLARGIDTAAHTGALEGGTVAVLAGGADIVYPKQNAALYEEIRERGTIVSEMPPGTQPQARQFPTRNRIISGLSLGIVVVEAALRSGSLITARLAGEQGRDVFAIPGFPLDPRARGANALIRNGATLAESAEDVLEGIRPLLSRQHDEPGFTGLGENDDLGSAELDSARTTILECLGPAPVTVDDLLRDSGLSTATLWAVLLELELAGRLERQPGGKVALLV